MRTEWVIHIWGKERESLEFTPQEKFHMDMIRSYNHSIFDKVLINIALHDINDESLFNFFKTELLDVFSDVKEIDIRKCQNERMLSEYVTFRPYVWDRIGEDVRIFYSHFKGYISNVSLLCDHFYPVRNMLLNEYYWSYLMYKMSLSEEYVNEMKKSFDDGKDVYCWCMLDESNLEYLCQPADGDFYTAHFRGIEEAAPYIKNYYVNEDGSEVPIPTFIGVSKGRTFNLANVMGHLTQIDLSYCSNIESILLALSFMSLLILLINLSSASVSTYILSCSPLKASDAIIGADLHIIYTASKLSQPLNAKSPISVTSSVI